MQHVERRITNKLVRAALAQGYKISVSDGEDYPVKRSESFREITEALGSTDSDSLVLRDAEGNRVGSILLVWGNGEDVISDHTDNEAINRLVDGISQSA